MRKYYNGGFVSMTTSLGALASAAGGADRSSPELGRAVIGAIRAASESAMAAHLTAGALERALAASEGRHDQGVQLLFDHLVTPVIEKVGGPVAAAVAKCCCCCLPCAGPQPAQQQQPAEESAGNLGPAALAAAAVATLGKHVVVEKAGLDARDLAAALELVDGQQLARLSATAAAMRATLEPLPAAKRSFVKGYDEARRVSAEVIDAAENQPEAAASVTAASVAAAAARNASTTTNMAPLLDLLDEANDEFTRSFQRVDGNLLISMAETFGGLADIANARTNTLHAALRASIESFEAKAQRDAAMLQSLRKIANSGEGSSSSSSSSDNAAGFIISSAASAALADVLAAYGRAVRAALERGGADFASAVTLKKKKRAALDAIIRSARAAAAAADADATAPRAAVFDGQYVSNNTKRSRIEKDEPNSDGDNGGTTTTTTDDDDCGEMKILFHKLEDSLMEVFTSAFPRVSSPSL